LETQFISVDKLTKPRKPYFEILVTTYQRVRHYSQWQQTSHFITNKSAKHPQENEKRSQMLLSCVNEFQLGLKTAMQTCPWQ